MLETGTQQKTGREQSAQQQTGREQPGRQHTAQGEPGGRLDVEAVREDFPILKESMRGKPLAYLDNGATSLKPQCVIDEVVRYYTKLSSNIHRGVYELSESATQAFDAARERIGEFINAPAGQSHVIFTRGTTDSVNFIVGGWGRKFIGEGDEIVLTEMEHHANFVPWQMLAKERGATLRFIPVDPSDGTLVLSDLDSIINERTKVLAVTAMSNVTGYMPPVKDLVRRARAVGAVTVVDGAQFVSHHPVDVQDLGCDFLVFSAHKMCGPTGVGALYGRAELLEQMDPYQYGGDMIVKVRKDRTTFKPLPEGFETGTPNIAGVLGFGKAVEYLQSIGMDAIHAHERELIGYALERAWEDRDLVTYGPSDPDIRGGIFSFNITDVHPHDAGTILDQEGIAVRTGFHCAQPLMQALGIVGTTRAAFYLYNTKGEIDRLFDGIERIKRVFL